MCARRFLLVAFLLVLIAVGGAFAIHQGGGEVLIRQAVPKGHYTAPPQSSGPDYAKLESWIARPGIVDDPSRWQPNEEAPYDRKGSVQTFYIHPTTYLERDRWNAPLLPGSVTEFRTRLFVQSQASAFYAVGSVWAPRYRQAAYGAFLLTNEDAQKALDLAYGDLTAAFDEFLRQVPDGEPIILAAHSQGALHLSRLFAERKDDLKGRLVASYVVGWPISVAADLPALGFPACRASDQTGCILSWMTFGTPANPDLILEQWEETRGLTGGGRKRDEILCVNPITGTQNGGSPNGIGGILVPNTDFRSASISYTAVSARCDNGLLIIDSEIPPLGPYVLPGNNYHVYDYALFWGAIRQDALRRSGAWQR